MDDRISLVSVPLSTIIISTICIDKLYVIIIPASFRDVDTFQPLHVHVPDNFLEGVLPFFNWTFSLLYYSFRTGHEELIQTLTWDGTGSRLLSTDLVGVCKLWVMKVRLLKLFYKLVCSTLCKWKLDSHSLLFRYAGWFLNKLVTPTGTVLNN